MTLCSSVFAYTSYSLFPPCQGSIICFGMCGALTMTSASNFSARFSWNFNSLNSRSSMWQCNYAHMRLSYAGISVQRSFWLSSKYSMLSRAFLTFSPRWSLEIQVLDLVPGTLHVMAIYWVPALSSFWLTDK
jgi:hypothetical protein